MMERKDTLIKEHFKDMEEDEHDLDDPLLLKKQIYGVILPLIKYNVKEFENTDGNNNKIQLLHHKSMLRIEGEIGDLEQ